jgi:hypothetical protein
LGPTFSGLPIRKLTGRIKIHPVGYGFVVPDDKSEDVHVLARNRGTAMDGDTVGPRARQDHRPAGAARPPAGAAAG